MRAGHFERIGGYSEAIHFDGLLPTRGLGRLRRGWILFPAMRRRFSSAFRFSTFPQIRGAYYWSSVR